MSFGSLSTQVLSRPMRWAEATAPQRVVSQGTSNCPMITDLRTMPQAEESALALSLGLWRLKAGGYAKGINENVSLMLSCGSKASRTKIR